MVLNTAQIIQLLISIQCLLFVIFLTTSSKGKRVSNYILGAFLGLLGIQMFLSIGFDTGYITPYFRHNGISGFLYGPLLYLYALSIQRRGFRFRKSTLIHFIPALISVPVMIVLPELNRLVVIISIHISLDSYLFASFLSISKYERTIRETQSQSDSISLKWLKHLVYFLAIAGVFDLTNNIFFPAEAWPIGVIYPLQMGVLFLMVISIVFKGLKQPELFSGITEEEVQISELNKEKYANSTLSNSDLEEYKERISFYFEKNEPYLDPQLSLNSLSECIGISPRDLSQVINSQFNRHFSDFINSYRIEKAIELFRKDKENQRTVLEILYEVGFNSKSSFYVAFKQQTGMTPKDFKQELIQNFAEVEYVKNFSG